MTGLLSRTLPNRTELLASCSTSAASTTLAGKRPSRYEMASPRPTRGSWRIELNYEGWDDRRAAPGHDRDPQRHPGREDLAGPRCRGLRPGRGIWSTGTGSSARELLYVRAGRHRPRLPGTIGAVGCQPARRQASDCRAESPLPWWATLRTGPGAAVHREMRGRGAYARCPPLLPGRKPGAARVTQEGRRPALPRSADRRDVLATVPSTHGRRTCWPRC